MGSKAPIKDIQTKDWQVEERIFIHKLLVDDFIQKINLRTYHKRITVLVQQDLGYLKEAVSES